jgi:hypothetical protein
VQLSYAVTRHLDASVVVALGATGPHAEVVSLDLSSYAPVISDDLGARALIHGWPPLSPYLSQLT